MLRRLGPRARILLPALLLIVGLGVIAAATLIGDGEQAPASRPQADEEIAPEAEPSGAAPTMRGPRIPPLDDEVTRGSKDAEVMIVEFGDYQCPDCRDFTREIEPALIKKYVDTGAVRFAWRDFPARGEGSMRAAVAARAAGRQGRFWEYHDALYEIGSGYTDDFLRDVAGRLGLDLARFDADRRDPVVRKVVEKDFTFAQQLGVPGTPAFLINGEPFFGAQPLKAFEKAIEKARR